MLGLSDREAFRRAYIDLRAILEDGTPSLLQHMDMVNAALADWLRDFGPGWLVETSYRAKKAWLRFLRVSEEQAEERALASSQRLAEGQLFRANDPRNDSTSPRPPGTYWDDLPPTTEGMKYHSAIFHIPPPGPDGPAALTPGGWPTALPSTDHGASNAGAHGEPTPPASASYDADGTEARHSPAAGTKRTRSAPAHDGPGEQQHVCPAMDDDTTSQHTPVIPTDTDPSTCTTPGCPRRPLFAHGTCCPRCTGAFGVRWAQGLCHTPGCDNEHAAMALPPPIPAAATTADTDADPDPSAPATTTGSITATCPTASNGTEHSAAAATTVQRRTPRPEPAPCPRRRHRHDRRTVARRASRFRPARHYPPRPPTGIADATRRCPARDRNHQPPPDGTHLPRTGPRPRWQAHAPDTTNHPGTTHSTTPCRHRSPPRTQRPPGVHASTSTRRPPGRYR